MAYRILAVTVTHDEDGKRRWDPRMVEAMKAIEHDPHTIDWLVTHEPGPPPARWPEDIRHNLEKARRIALEIGYNFLWIVESDIIVPANALQLLIPIAERGVPAGGLYRLRPEKSGWGQHAAAVPAEDLPTGWRFISRRLHFPQDEPLPVIFHGYGCLMVPRVIFHSVPFDQGNDVSFAARCYAAGVPVHVVPLCACGHICYDGRILWPETAEHETDVNEAGLPTAPLRYSPAPGEGPGPVRTERGDIVEEVQETPDRMD